MIVSWHGVNKSARISPEPTLSDAIKPRPFESCRASGNGKKIAALMKSAEWRPWHVAEQDDMYTYKKRPHVLGTTPEDN